jgi:hypothetical protein
MRSEKNNRRAGHTRRYTARLILMNDVGMAGVTRPTLV